MKHTDIDDMTPREIVEQLDVFIIGQEKAKKMIAIALRNRARRRKLPDELRDEIAPKNIIMIGSTGVGKTEIARRISKLVGAPFIKVEATKYTEVGYVGRDVESMIRDLMSAAVSIVQSEIYAEVQPEAAKRAEERVLDKLLPSNSEKNAVTSPPPSNTSDIISSMMMANQNSQNKTDNSEEFNPVQNHNEESNHDAADSLSREHLRGLLRDGKLDDKEIEILIAHKSSPSVEIFSGAIFEEMDVNLGNLSSLFGNRRKKRVTNVKRALELLTQEEAEKLVDMDQISEIARNRVEQMGIVFIDEIDKIASRDGRSGIDVSREGVQRDILPIVEGSKVNTRQGIIDTSHILFIAAGAFHASKPSDLIPELQGRFPLRVELEKLNSDDFYRILTQPKNALIRQYIELLKTEDVTLEFRDDAIRELSDIATTANSRSENIGARRLHTIMELLLEDISFNAPDLRGQTISITVQYVNERLHDVLENEDLSRYIL